MFLLSRPPVQALFPFLALRWDCLQCFDAVGWATPQQEGHPACKKLEWWDGGVIMCLGQGADLHIAQLMPLPLTISCSSKSRLL